MPRPLFPLALLAAGLLLSAARADDPPGEEAITLLEARKAQAEKKGARTRSTGPSPIWGGCSPLRRRTAARPRPTPSWGSSSPGPAQEEVRRQGGVQREDRRTDAGVRLRHQGPVEGLRLGGRQAGGGEGAVSLEAATDIRHVAEFKTSSVEPIGKIARRRRRTSGTSPSSRP